ncbi:MAG: type II toxin-antitoxin system ParD family antitoxin [Tepidisphaerales bacterium]
MSISLPAVLKEWVDMRVETCGYGTASEYIREMIRREREDFVPGGNTPENRRRIHARIEEGWRQSEQGLGRDGAEVFAEVRQRLQKGTKSRQLRKTGTAR